MNTQAFADVPTAIEEIRAGHMIVVVDDEDRENEGDITLAAEKVTPEAINTGAFDGSAASDTGGHFAVE